MKVALVVVLAGMLGACSSLAQPTRQMTELVSPQKNWNWVVTVFSGDKPPQHTGSVFGDESDCLAAAREEGDKHRDEGIVGIVCVDPEYFAELE